MTAVCYLNRHLVTAALTDAGTTLPAVPHCGVCDLAGASRKARQMRDGSLAALRDVSKQTAASRGLPGTQHPLDVFASARRAHVVRGVDRFLRSAYDGWREGAA